VSEGSVIRRLGDLSGAMRHYRRLTSVGTSREELLALQRRCLVRTARHAAAASPIYRELYAGIELAEDLDVRALPVVTKAMLMERFDEWVTDPRLHRSDVDAHLERVHGDELYLGVYRCMPTGGTTGSKGIFVYDRDEWRRCLTAFLRWSELTGVRPRLGRRMRIATVGATSPLHMTARFAMSIDLGVYALRQLDARTPLCEIVAALNEHRPEQLVAYSSMASLLAIEQLERRLQIFPRLVCTTSEVRTEEMTANIRAAWAVEPFDLYGTTESLYAGDCEYHQGMHVFEDLGLMEVVDPHGEPVPDGVTGAKLLITSFIKRTQPVLRYEISDMVARSTAPCLCGRPLARMVSVEGRSDDVLHMKGADGRSIALHPLTLRSPMAALPELRQYKIVHDNDGLHVLVALRDAVAADQAARRIEATLRSRLASAGVADPRLEVAIVAELPREQGHSAKFKLIESRTGSGGVATPGVDAPLLPRR
jgi:phenylacetate-coenzyme A ligase PaaK-like adenylate-forming protein